MTPYGVSSDSWWRRMGIMASPITRKSVVCSNVCLVNNKENIKAPTSPLWGERFCVCFGRFVIHTCVVLILSSLYCLILLHQMGRNSNYLEVPEIELMSHDIKYQILISLIQFLISLIVLLICWDRYNFLYQ